jgi:hypothetical protein
VARPGDQAAVALFGLAVVVGVGFGAAAANRVDRCRLAEEALLPLACDAVRIVGAAAGV